MGAKACRYQQRRSVHAAWRLRYATRRSRTLSCAPRKAAPGGREGCNSPQHVPPCPSKRAIHRFDTERTNVIRVKEHHPDTLRITMKDALCGELRVNPEDPSGASSKGRNPSSTAKAPTSATWSTASVGRYPRHRNILVLAEGEAVHAPRCDRGPLRSWRRGEDARGRYRQRDPPTFHVIPWVSSQVSICT